MPNGSSAAVFLKDVLTQKHSRGDDSKLDLAIGKDTSGKAIVTDLAEMPHLIDRGDHRLRQDGLFEQFDHVHPL